MWAQFSYYEEQRIVCDEYITLAEFDMNYPKDLEKAYTQYKANIQNGIDR